jgi:hypothetical protein
MLAKYWFLLRSLGHVHDQGEQIGFFEILLVALEQTLAGEIVPELGFGFTFQGGERQITPVSGRVQDRRWRARHRGRSGNKVRFGQTQFFQRRERLRDDGLFGGHAGQGIHSGRQCFLCDDNSWLFFVLPAYGETQRRSRTTTTKGEKNALHLTAIHSTYIHLRQRIGFKLGRRIRAQRHVPTNMRATKETYIDSNQNRVFLESDIFVQQSFAVGWWVATGSTYLCPPTRMLIRNGDVSSTSHDWACNQDETA